MEIWITLPADFDTRLAAFKERLFGTPVPGATAELSYDAETAKFSFRGQYLSVPLSSNQAVVAAALFSEERELGSWLEEEEVYRDFFKATDKSFYNAVRALNAAFEERFGIEAFKYAKNRARVQIEIISKK